MEQQRGFEMLVVSKAPGGEIDAPGDFDGIGDAWCSFRKRHKSALRWSDLYVVVIYRYLLDRAASVY